VIAIAGRLVQIMQHRHDCGAAIPLLRHHLHQRHLVIQVQIGRRLIQQQIGGLLRQCHRQEGTLLLTARKLVHPPIRNDVGMRGCHHPVHDLAVCLAQAPPEIQVGTAPVAYQGTYRDALRHQLVLGQQ